MTPDDNKPRIVIVDDEEMVLTSLKSFLDLETEYRVESFKNPLEALEFIKTNDIDLVVSDYLMPEMDGISFLGEVRHVRPDVPRIILTGYADKENAIKAINDVQVFQSAGVYSRGTRYRVGHILMVVIYGNRCKSTDAGGISRDIPGV